MVAIITPLYLIVEGLVVYFWQGNHFSVYYYLLVVLLTTIYNLVFVPVVYHVLKNIVHE